MTKPSHKIEDYTSIVRLLLEKGADINVQDKWGRTALMMAAREGRLELVRLLLDWEADINIRNENGYTAVMLAAWRGHVEVVQALLDRGADVNAVGGEQRYSALLLASGGPEQHRENEQGSQENEREEGQGGE